MKIWNTLLLILSTCLVHGQAQLDGVYMLNVSSSLPFIFFFYLVTVLSLGLYLIKLLNPRFSSKWIYLCSIIGIIGAIFVNISFEQIKENQLPKVGQIEGSSQPLSEHNQQQLNQLNREVENQTYANFWIISIPNFIILALAFVTDYKNRGKDLSLPRTRYD